MNDQWKKQKTFYCVACVVLFIFALAVFALYGGTGGLAVLALGAILLLSCIFLPPRPG